MALTDGKIENVTIANNEVTLCFLQNENSDKFVINQKLDDWTIVFSQPKGKYKKWMLNGNNIKPELIGEVEQFKISDRINNVELVK